MQKNETLLYSGLGIAAVFFIIRKLYKMSENKKQLSPHFTFAEFNSHDGAPMPEPVKKNIKELAKNLEIIRAAAGNKPIKINSGWRSPRYNAAVGGKEKSMHLQGKAADFYIPGMPVHHLHALVSNLIDQGQIKQGGLGRYDSFVHYDVRGTKARW